MAGGCRGALAALWRRSLQFRTVIITLGLSGLAILVIGLYISFSVASNLFQAQREACSRRRQRDGRRPAHPRLSDAADRASLQLLMASAIGTISSVSGSTDVALFREPGQPPDRWRRPTGWPPRSAAG